MRASPTALLLTLALACSSWAARPLRYRFVPGEEARFRLKIVSRTAVQIGERDTETKLTSVLNMTQRTLALAKDGVARVLTRVDSGRVKQGEEGAISQMMPPRESTMRVDSRGRIIEGEQGSTQLAPLRMVFPEKKVSLGESWTSSLPPSKDVPVPVQVRYTLVKMAKVHDLSCVEIGVRIQSANASRDSDAPLDLSFQAGGVLYFSLEKGMVVRGELESDLEFVFLHPTELGLEPVETHMALDLKLEYRPGL